MRHLLVSSSDPDLADALRPLLPPEAVLLSARGIDETLETLSRSSRIDAVFTDDPAVLAAIREEIPGTLPVHLVPRRGPDSLGAPATENGPDPIGSRGALNGKRT